MDEPKAFIFRYYACPKEKDKYLCDDGDLADPDFFTNIYKGEVIPIWSICGVFHRSRLNQHDMIFFLPAKHRLKKIKSESYICTGVLVVGRILEDKNVLLGEPTITDSYKTTYESDLGKHLEKDKVQRKEKTLANRPLNIILGDPKESLWFGSNNLDFRMVLSELGISEISNLLPHRNNVNLLSLNHEQATKLYAYLKVRLSSIHDSTHNHSNRAKAAYCSGCNK